MSTDTPEDPETIAAGYVRYARGLRSDDQDPDAIWDPERDPDCRHYGIVHEAVREGPPEVAWPLVRAVLDASPDEELAANAVGPLEDLVRHHGAALVDAIERAATDDERFKWALGTIWLTEADLPLDVLDRIVHASGDVLKVLERLPGKPARPTTPEP